MYADYEYYAATYRLNTSPVIPEDVYLYWERQARSEIDKRTMGRLTARLELVSEPVKDCVCEIAELLYRADMMSQRALEQGGAGPLVSYSNDGDSGTFDLSQSPYTELGKVAKIRSIINKYLAYTGLLYTGVR